MKVKFTLITTLLLMAGPAPLYVQGNLIRSANGKLNCRKMGKLSIMKEIYLEIKST